MRARLPQGGRVFFYLHGFRERASGPNTIEYKIGEIFAEIKNKITSGYNLREIIDQIDGLRFRSQTEKHELSHLYEAKIRNIGNAGRNEGKTNPLNDEDLAEFVALQKTREIAALDRESQEWAAHRCPARAARKHGWCHKKRQM